MNTIKTLTVISLVTLVAGCMATPEEKASLYCSDQLGLEAGTADYQNCHVLMTQQYWAVRAQAVGMMHQGLQNSANTIGGQSQSTTCNVIGNSVYCNSY